jgi:hypothetical protein
MDDLQNANIIGAGDCYWVSDHSFSHGDHLSWHTQHQQSLFNFASRLLIFYL